MNKIVIILAEDGTFDTVYANDELEARILTRGEHDREIDETEKTLEEIIS